MKTPLIFVTIALILVSSVAVYKVNKLRTGTSAENTLTIGTASGYAPFVSVDASGNYEGFDIDVAKEIAAHLGKKLVLKDLGSMTALFMALDQGSIDGIIWGLSITQDRLKKVAMVRYQGETTRAFSLIFWKAIPPQIKSINDMKGMTVCVEPTSTQDMVLSKYPFIIKKATEKVDDALFNIQYSKVDAAFVEPAIAQKFQRKYPEIKTLDVPLEKEDQVEGIGIAVKKENTKLIDALTQAVKKITTEGKIQRFEQKWGVQ
jgi:ABC-type amino acid transport substrate-binding protein